MKIPKYMFQLPLQCAAIKLSPGRRLRTVSRRNAAVERTGTYLSRVRKCHPGERQVEGAALYSQVLGGLEQVFNPFTLSLLAGLVFLAALPAPVAAAPDPRAIMQQVIDRDDGEARYTRSVIATCRYRKQGGKIKCVERPRVKVLEGVEKDFGPEGKDTRGVTIVLEPAAERGIGFLQYDYDDPDRETDQWMYLSALGKVKRLVSGKANEPKRGTLFGSEIGYEDIERPHTEDYVYTLLREEEWDGRPTWVIESRPTPKRARRSNYSRAIQWIDRERMLTLRVLLYDRGGRPVKQITMSNVFRQDGIWVVGRLNVNNVQTRRITTMKTESIVINPVVDDELLTLRTLTDGTFRERRLEALRARLGTE